MNETIQIDTLPRSVEDFLALRDTIATTPQGGAAMMVVALIVAAADLDSDLSQACMTIALDRGQLQAGSEGYKGWQLGRRDWDRLRRQLGRQPYLPQSYIQGTSPDSGYALPQASYDIALSTNPHSGDAQAGPFKVFVACSGASSPRPVTLKRNNHGLWKASEWSSLVVGIQPAKQVVDDDL